MAKGAVEHQPCTQLGPRGIEGQGLNGMMLTSYRVLCMSRGVLGHVLYACLGAPGQHMALHGISQRTRSGMGRRRLSLTMAAGFGRYEDGNAYNGDNNKWNILSCHSPDSTCGVLWATPRVLSLTCAFVFQ